MKQEDLLECLKAFLHAVDMEKLSICFRACTVEAFCLGNAWFVRLPADHREIDMQGQGGCMHGYLWFLGGLRTCTRAQRLFATIDRASIARCSLIAACRTRTYVNFMASIIFIGFSSLTATSSAHYSHSDANLLTEN